jgi:hypothetical protein
VFVKCQHISKRVISQDKAVAIILLHTKGFVVKLPSIKPVIKKPPEDDPYFHVCGLDISLSNLGMAKFRYYLTDGYLEAWDARLVTTQAEPKKSKVRKNSDDLNRCRSLIHGLEEFTSDCRFLFIELPVGSQSARAMASYGACCGIAASIKKPLILVMPLEVKAITGKNLASKDAMIAWAVKLFPDIPWLRERGKKDGHLVKANEHIADACAAVKAGVLTEPFLNAVAYAKG